MTGGESIKALSGFGPACLKGAWITTEATGDCHRVYMESSNMKGGLNPMDLPVLNVAGTADGLKYVSFGPGQYLPENSEITIKADNADAGNAAFTSFTADISYHPDDIAKSGDFVCYRVPGSADATTRVITKAENVLSGGKLDSDREYYFLGVLFHTEQADAAVTHMFRLLASAFQGKTPGGGGGTVLPENTSEVMWYNEKDGLSKCPVIKGDDQLDIEWLSDGAQKPVPYLLLWTPSQTK